MNSRNCRSKLILLGMLAAFICHDTFGMPQTTDDEITTTPLTQDSQAVPSSQQPQLHKINVIITMSAPDQQNSPDKYFNSVKIAAEGAEFLIQGPPPKWPFIGQWLPYHMSYKKRYARILSQGGGHSWRLMTSEQPQTPVFPNPVFPNKSEISNLPFTSKNDLDGVLQHPAFPDASSTLLIMLGHGLKSSNGSFEEVGFSLWQGDDQTPQKLTMEQLREAIEHRAHNSITHEQESLRILSATCFGGGIHYITSKAPNVCGAATTTFNMISGSDIEHSKFIEGFWEYIRTQKDHRKISFGEAVPSTPLFWTVESHIYRFNV